MAPNPNKSKLNPVTTPLPQRIVTVGFYLFAGISVVAIPLAALNNAMALIKTPSDSLYASGFIAAGWLAIELYVLKFHPQWIVAGSSVQVTSLGIQPRLAVAAIICVLWAPPVVNYFKAPEEVSLLPHVQYEYASNYPQKYFRRTQGKQLGELEAKLTFQNNSKYTLENIEVKTYIHCIDDDVKKFFRPYYLNTSDFLLIGSIKNSRMEFQKKIILDLPEVLKTLFRTHENLIKVVLPEMGRSQSLPKLKTYCSGNKSALEFTDNEIMLQEEYFPLIPSNIHMGREAEYGFNGAMLKIIFEYDVNNVRFKHLLVGGLYYKYIITTQIPVPYKEGPVGVAVSGFFKADNSLWKRKDKERFSSAIIPQEVVDVVEEGEFVTSVGGPVQPGQEVTLRVRPDKAYILPKGKFLPIPMYLYVENNVRTPQPDNTKGVLNVVATWK